MGTVFDKSVKPFPTSIIEEIQMDRIPPTFKVLEYEIIPEKEEIKEEKPEVLKDVSSKPKPSKLKLRRKAL